MHVFVVLGGLGLVGLLLSRRRESFASGYSAGQAVTRFASAIEEASAMSSLLQQASSLMALQQAGQFGVRFVAPAIDSAGQPRATKLLTQQAWLKNGTLHSPGITDETWARRIAFDMLHLYWQAIADGQKAERGQTAPRPSQAPAGPASVPPDLLAAARVLLAAIRATTAAGQPVFWTRERGQGPQMWHATYNFQRAYNASGLGQVALDGVYGGATDFVLKNVLVSPPAVSSPAVSSANVPVG